MAGRLPPAPGFCPATAPSLQDPWVREPGRQGGWRECDPRPLLTDTSGVFWRLWDLVDVRGPGQDPLHPSWDPFSLTLPVACLGWAGGGTEVGG